MIAIGVLTAAARPAWPADSPLDLRRIEALRQVDTADTLGPQDNAYPAPNRTLSNSDMQAYLVKALTVLALADQGAAPASRRAEASQLLRYALNRWPASTSNALIGQYATSWNHRERSLGTRLYFLYRQDLDPDILQNLQNRMLLACVDPYDQSSENIKCTTNALIYLAHEASNKTNLSSFASIRSWWLGKLNDFGTRGFSEWGSPYHFWTVGAVQNLAEFALDAQVRARAVMVLDYTLACMSGFSIDRYFNSSAIRRWYWTFCMTEPHTNAIQILFGQAPAENYFLWCEWSATNYRPPAAVEALYARTRNTETQLTLTGRWHMRSYVMDRAAISTHQTFVDNYYGSTGEGGETHDIVQCMVQSVGDDLSHVMTYAIQPDVQKYRCTHDRSFGYRNVALVNGGGFTRKAWASGTISNVPIRLYRGDAFSVAFDSGWAFLTDGNIYVAWAPTLGSPIVDPNSAAFAATCGGGAFLRSDFTPDDNGEAAVLEVGDPESFGSFAAFQSEIKTRNPRPRWSAGRVQYTARDGAVLELGTSDAKINGIAVDLAAFPRAFSTVGINGFAIQAGQRSLQYDFPGAAVTGPSTRMIVSRVYGQPPVPIQGPLGTAPVVIPATIQAEEYDRGGEGLGYHDATAGNSWNQYRTDDVDIQTTGDAAGGFNVGWIEAGEWLEFTIEAPAAAAYPVSLRVAADPAGTASISFHLELDGVDVTGTQSTPPTTGWQDWKTVSVGNVAMPAGRHILRVTMDTGGWNLNWIGIGAAPVVYPMDFDHDHDVDQSDFAHLQECLIGYPQTVSAECQDANLNHDDLVDELDLILFLGCMAGPNRVPGC